MNNDKFQTIVNGNKNEELFNPNQKFSCQYNTEDEFIIKNRNGDDFLNIFSLNIRRLPKHGSELLNILGSLKTDFHVIILTGIAARNLTVVEKKIPNYTFFHKIHKNTNNPWTNAYMLQRKTLNPIINPRKTTTRTVINKLVYTG